jgi:tetratricopeptide (TPR) repeat protein
MANKELKKNKSKQKNLIADKKNRNKIILILAAIVVITIVVFSNSLNNDFIRNWDDKGYLMDNPYVQNFSTASLKPIFTSFYNANYHPLTTLTYAIELKKFGLNPKPFHIDNLIVHILNILLVFWLIQLLTKRIEASTIVALFFAIHPMHVESVSWISERKDVLYTFFYLAGLITYLFYLSNRNTKYIISTFILFLLSLFSKSAAVSFPLMLVLFDFYYSRNFDKKNIIEKIPFFILSIVFGILAVLSQRTLGAIQDLTPVFSIIDRIFLVSYGILFYIVKLFVPIGLSAVHSYPIKSGGLLPAIYYISPVILLLIAFGVYKAGAYKKELLFGFLFFMISIALVIQVIPVGKALTAERYSYVPYIGLFFILSRTYCDIQDEKFALVKKIKPLFTLLLAGYAIYFCFTTWERNKVWKDGMSLFEDVIQKNPMIDYAYINRAHAKSDLGDHKSAIEDYNKAISINPHFAESFNNRGNERYMLKDKDGAVADYNKAIEVDRKYALAYFNRAIAKGDMMKYQEAIADYSSAIASQPVYPDAYYNRGNIKIKLQDFKGAIGDYQETIKYKPQFADAYHNIGVAKYNMQDFDGAIRSFTEAVTVNPQYAEAYANRAAAKLYLKRIDEACEDWRKAFQFGFKNVDVFIKQYCR